MTSFNRFVATLLCGAIALSLPVPLQAQSPAACDAAIDKLQKDTEQLGKDLDADVKEFVKSEYADETLKGVRNHFKNKPAVGAAFDLKDKWDSFTSWVEETKRARVTMEDLGRCINTKGCSLIEFAKRQNEVIAKWIQKLGDEGLSAAAERVNKQASIIRNYAERTLHTATGGTLDTVQKCETRIEQQSTTNNQAVNQPGAKPAPSSTAAPVSSGGGGGGNTGALIGILGAAIGGGLAYGYYAKSQEELAASTGGGSTTTGGGGGSGSAGVTYSVSVGTRTCVAGANASEPCANFTPGGTCGPTNFTFTVSNGTVQACNGYLTGSVSGSSFTGNYNGSCGNASFGRGPAVQGGIPSAGGTTTISGTSTCLGNQYTISMTVTRR